MALGGQKFRFTRHALRRLEEMGVKAQAVNLALRNPERVHDVPGRDVSYWTRGDITLVVAWDDIDSDVISVRTVLWSTAGKWSNHFEKNPGSKRFRARGDWTGPAW